MENRKLNKQFDDECEKEAIKRGYKDWTEFFIKANWKESYEVCRQVGKKLNIPLWKIGN